MLSPIPRRAASRLHLLQRVCKGAYHHHHHHHHHHPTLIRVAARFTTTTTPPPSPPSPSSSRGISTTAAPGCPFSFRNHGSVTALSVRDARDSMSSSSTAKRSFSTTRQLWLRTKEMNGEQLASLKVDQERLMRELHFTCQWGVGERWGEYVCFFLSSPFIFRIRFCFILILMFIRIPLLTYPFNPLAFSVPSSFGKHA